MTNSKNIQAGPWKFSLNNYGKLFVEREGNLTDITPDLGFGLWISDFDVYYDEDSIDPSMRLAASVVFLDASPSGETYNIRFQSPFSSFGGGTHYISSDPFVADQIYFQGKDNKLARIKIEGSEEQLIGSGSSVSLASSSPFVAKDGWLYFRENVTDHLCKVKWDGTEKQQIGGQITSSRPFVTPDKWIYFRGTNDKLYQIKVDGRNFREILNCETSDGISVSDHQVYFRSKDNKLLKKQPTDHIPDYLISSKPFVMDDWIYFQGRDNGLYKVKTDGTDIERIGNNATKSSPFVSDGWVYFQGLNDGLYKVRTDGSDTKQIWSDLTKSTPFVVDGWIYFQGTDDKLYKVKDGTNTTRLGDNSIKSTPFVAGNWVYFQDTSDRLYRVKTDGSQGHPIGAEFLGRDLFTHDPDFGGGAYDKSISSPPFVLDDYVYYRNKDDNRLCKIKVNSEATFERYHPVSGTKNHEFLGVFIKSSPLVVDGWVYFQGIDDGLGRVKTDGSNYQGLHQSIISAPFLSKGYIYGQRSDYKIMQIRSDNTSTEAKVVSSNSIFSTPFIADDGYIYFKGEGNKLERIKEGEAEPVWVGKAYTESSAFVVGDTIYYQNFGDNRLIAQKISTENELPIVDNKSSKIYTTDNLNPDNPIWDPKTMWTKLSDPKETTTYCKSVIAITSNDITSLFYPSYLSSIELKLPHNYLYYNSSKKSWANLPITEDSTYTLSEVSLVKCGQNHSLICALRENQTGEKSPHLYFTGNIFSNNPFTLMLNHSISVSSGDSSSVSSGDTYSAITNSAQYQSFIKDNNLIILSVEDILRIGKTEGITWMDPKHEIYVFTENCGVYGEVKAKSISIFANKIDGLSLPNEETSTEILNKNIGTTLSSTSKEIINFWDRQKNQFFHITVEQDTTDIKVTGTSISREPTERLFVHPTQCQMLLQKALLLYSQGTVDRAKVLDDELKDAKTLLTRIKNKLEIFIDPTLQKEPKLSNSEYERLKALYEEQERDLGSIKSIETIQNIYNIATTSLLKLYQSQDYWGNSYFFVPTESYKYYESQLQDQVDNFKQIEEELLKFWEEKRDKSEKINILRNQRDNFEETKGKAIKKVIEIQKEMAKTHIRIEELQTKFAAKSTELLNKIDEIKSQEEETKSSDDSFVKKHPKIIPLVQGLTGLAFIGMAVPGLGLAAGLSAAGGTVYTMLQGMQNAADSQKLIEEQTKIQEAKYIVNKLEFLTEEIKDSDTITNKIQMLQNGTIDTENLNANKLLVDQNAFENFIRNLHDSHPELASIQDEFNQYVNLVVSRNNEILTYNALATLMTQNLAVIEDAINHTDVIGEENLENYDPDLPAFVSSMQQAHKNAHSDLMLLFYKTERALQFYGPTDSKPFLESIKSSIVISDGILRTALSKIKNTYDLIREKITQNNTYYHFKGVQITLNESAIEKLKDPESHSASVDVGYNHDIARYNNVRVTDVKVYFQGVNGKIEGNITNKGIEKITDFDGNQFTFQHSPIKYDFLYDPKHDKPSEFTSVPKKRAGTIDSKENKYISGETFLPGIFAEWQIDIHSENNPDLDLKNLSGASIEFEGYGYHV